MTIIQKKNNNVILYNQLQTVIANYGIDIHCYVIRLIVFDKSDLVDDDNDKKYVRIQYQKPENRKWEYVSLQNVKPNDYLLGSMGHFFKVKSIIYHSTEQESLVEIISSGARVTKKHPIFYGGNYCRPKTLTLHDDIKEMKKQTQQIMVANILLETNDDIFVFGCADKPVAGQGDGEDGGEGADGKPKLNQDEEWIYEKNPTLITTLGFCFAHQ